MLLFGRQVVTIGNIETIYIANRDKQSASFCLNVTWGQEPLVHLVYIALDNQVYVLVCLIKHVPIFTQDIVKILPHDVPVHIIV